MFIALSCSITISPQTSAFFHLPSSIFHHPLHIILLPHSPHKTHLQHGVVMVLHLAITEHVSPAGLCTCHDETQRNERCPYPIISKNRQAANPLLESCSQTNSFMTACQTYPPSGIIHPAPLPSPPGPEEVRAKPSDSTREIPHPMMFSLMVSTMYLTSSSVT